MIYRYSSIQTALSCLYRYKLENIDRVTIPETSGDMYFGKAIHSAISAHFREEDALEYFNFYFSLAKEKSLNYTRYSLDQLLNIGQIMISRWVRLHAKKYKPYKFEERVKYKIGSYDFEGTPDFIGEYEGIPSIVDFKTSAKEYNRTKIITNEQLYLYAEAARQVYGYKAKQLAYTVFLKDEKPRIQTNIKLELTDRKQEDMISNIELVVKDLETRKEFPKNRNSCGYCPHFKTCYGDK